MKFLNYENIAVKVFVETIEKYGNPELTMRLPNESDVKYRERLINAAKENK